MSYLERILGEGEKFISHGEFSGHAIFPDLIISGIMSAIWACYVTSFDPEYLSDLDMLGEKGDYEPMWLYILIFAVIALIMHKSLKMCTIELRLTNQRVIGKYGIINTKILNSPLDKVNGITVEQDLLGKIFGYRKIVILTSSGVYKFNYTKNADSFRSAVMEQIDIAEEEKLRKQAEQLAGAMK